MRRVSALPLLLLGLACGGSRRTTTPRAPESRIPPMTSAPAAFQPTLSLSPMDATLVTGESMSFTAQINYVPDGPRYFRQPVTFKVEEAGGGTITLAGGYTAPSQPGTYHVVAQRDDFPSVKARATVLVKTR